MSFGYYKFNLIYLIGSLFVFSSFGCKVRERTTQAHLTDVRDSEGKGQCKILSVFTTELERIYDLELECSDNRLHRATSARVTERYLAGSTLLCFYYSRDDRLVQWKCDSGNVNFLVEDVVSGSRDDRPVALGRPDPIRNSDGISTAMDCSSENEKNLNCKDLSLSEGASTCFNRQLYKCNRGCGTWIGPCDSVKSACSSNLPAGFICEDGEKEFAHCSGKEFDNPQLSRSIAGETSVKVRFSNRCNQPVIGVSLSGSGTVDLEYEMPPGSLWEVNAKEGTVFIFRKKRTNNLLRELVLDRSMSALSEVILP